MSAKRRLVIRLFPLFLVLLALPVHAALNLQHWQTRQGARVVFVENRDLPILDISVDFAAGSAYDRPGKYGVASLTRHLMGLGAGAWSEKDIAERLADVGAVMGGHIDGDRASFELRMLSGQAEREQALAVLAAILQQPHFPKPVIEREKARTIAGLKESRIQPEVIGAEAFQIAIYGEHPYSAASRVGEAGVAKLRQADFVDFHRRHYRAKALSIAIMGDVGRAEAEAIAEQLAKGLPAGEAPAPVSAVAVNPVGKTQVLPHHASQSHLFMGLPGLKREDPDYFPLLVGNYVLGGGGFDSRLMKEIRQQRGLAYSTYSYFSPMAELGPFQIGLQTKRESTDEAVRVVHETLRRFVEEGPSEAELAQAKNNMIGGFPLRLDSNKKILGYLGVIGFYRLPLDWLDSYMPRVAAVTREDIVRAFRGRVPLAAVQTVIVGGQADGAAGK
ncbi:MAG: insulinase family protein [Betaproteobacteria bacterium]|nr:insulinase family protein [Betaproteobacteria bacterium]